MGYGIGIVDSAGTGAAAGYGSIYVTGGSLISAANYLGIGNRFGQGDLTISGFGIVNVSANPASIGSSDSNAVGILNLNGGSLQTGEVNKGSGAGTSYVNFNGGTLRANNADVTFMTGLTRATINGVYTSGGVSYAGGATIDTNGNAVTIGQNLLAPAGNGVAVSADFSPITGLIGAPFVLVTGGGGTGATAQAIFDAATGTVTGITVTNPGVGYSGTLTFQMVGGGLTGTTSIAATTVANTSGGLTKTGAGTLTLTGSNTFSGDTVVNSGTLALGNANALSQSTLNYNNQGGTLSFGTLRAATLGGLKGAQNLALANTSGSSVALTVGGNNADTAYSGALTGSGTLNKVGSGAMTLSGSVSVAGMTVNNGTVQLAQSGSIGAVSIGTSGTLSMAAHSGSTYNVLDTSSLSFSGTTGSIDIGNNAMIVRAANQTDLAAKVSLVQSKVNTAADLLAWDGQGITASAVLDDLQVNGVLTIMVYDNSQLYLDHFAGVGGFGSFDEVTGDPIDFNQVPLKVTYLGDLNGDGMVDGSDYGYMDYYFQSTLALGDLNGDGIVDGSDYGLLDYGFQTQVYGVLTSQAVASANLSSAAGSTGNPAAPASPEAVPEPGAFGLISAGLGLLLGNRRMRRRSQPQCCGRSPL